MKKYFPDNETPENKLSYYLVMCFFVSFPLDRFYSQAILICLLVHTLFHSKKNQLKRLNDWRFFWLMSVFLLAVISTLYSSYFERAWEELGRQLAILLVPALFLVTNLDIVKYKDHFLYGFAISCTLNVCYLFFDAWRIINYQHLGIGALFLPAFTSHNFSQPIELHATYFSMYSSLSLIFLLERIIVSPSRNLVLNVSCVIILLAGLVELCSRSVFISLVILVNTALPVFLFKGRKRLVVFACTLLISGASVVMLTGNDNLYQRFFVDLRIDLSLSRGSGNNRIQLAEPRAERWKVALALIKEKPLVGHGSGSEISLLKEGYFAKKLYHSYLHQLNAHNQYLSLLIKSGIAGLLVYLATLVWGFKMMIRKKDLTFFCFLGLVIFVSFAENILDVNKGIFFYAAFFTLFAMVRK